MKIRRRRSGEYSLSLDPWQKDLLSALVPQIRDLLLDDSSPMIKRLYPTAHPDDAESNAAYEALVHDQLLALRLDALDVLESQIGESRISGEDLETWMRAVNAIRLVVGTRLDVSEDHHPGLIAEDDPDRALWVGYYLLSETLGAIIDALES